MSYRSLKHVLGETNLERKCRLLFGLCLLLLIMGSFWFYGRLTEDLVYKQNYYKGRLLVDTILVLKHWETIDARSQDGEDALFVKSMGQRLQNQEYSFRAIRPPSSNPGQGVSEGQPGDGFEWALVEQFIKAPPPAPPKPTAPGQPPPDEPQIEWSSRLVANGTEYQYYQAIRATSTCVHCHKVTDPNPNLASGDLLRVMQVRIPTGPTQLDLERNRGFLLFTAILTVFLAMVASWVIVRYVIVKPLGHLKDVSDAISRGNVETRAEIRTGDEFEQLGLAFNRMLRYLVEAQQELRHVNADLDAKVDELARMNLQLFELNRLKSDFLATMSHELRTPLNSILGFSDVLVTGGKLEEKQQRFVQNIQKSGKMLLDLINDILDLAKIEAGKMDLRPCEFAVESVVQSQCDMARPLAEKRNIDLLVDMAPGLPPLWQDRGKVQQILNNLLSNAVKFTPEGGRIEVRTRRAPDGQLLLVVSDTGVGIAEEDQVAIFEKFRQGRTAMPGGDAMTREYSGTGLGLSIVRELCRLLGGDVSVESELGKGSTFTVRLPWQLPDGSTPPAPSGDLDLDALTRPRRTDFAAGAPAAT
ncbi:MAG: HAMP domain-containing protein [Pirellulales bacterium]|nr:HAMP domain-containing protein [Pirellulales bacterium]